MVSQPAARQVPVMTPYQPSKIKRRQAPGKQASLRSAGRYRDRA
jgi:hypothetical protein